MKRTYSLTNCPRVCAIYLINAYGRLYVGQSVGCDIRGDQHHADLLNGTHCNSLFMKALNGLEGRARLKKLSRYTMQILEVCPADVAKDKLKRKQWLNEHEDYWMAQLNAECNRVWSSGRTIKRNRFGKITNYQVTRPKSQPSRRRSTPAIDTGLGSVFIGSAVAFLLLLLGCALVEMWG